MKAIQHPQIDVQALAAVSAAWGPLVPRTSLACPGVWSNELSEAIVQHMGVPRLWELLTELRRAEAERLGVEDAVVFVKEALDSADVHLDTGALAKRYVGSRVNAPLYDAFVPYLRRSKSGVGLLDTDEGHEEFREASSAGPVLVLPFHVGPTHLLLPSVVEHFRLNALAVSAGKPRVSRLSFRGGGRLDLAWANDETSAARVVSALREGRTAFVAPDYSAAAGRLTSTPFFGTNLLVPTAWLSMARAGRAHVFTLLPVPTSTFGVWRVEIAKVEPDISQVFQTLSSRMEALDLIPEWWFWCLIQVTSRTSTGTAARRGDI